MTLHRQESVDNKVKFSEFIDYADKFSKKNNIKFYFPFIPEQRL